MSIIRGLAARPGAVAWSPDGSKLAVAAESLLVFDTETGNRTDLEIRGPLYVCWLGTGELVVLGREEGKKTVSLVDIGTKEVRRLKTGIEADAVYPLKYGEGRRTVVLLSYSARVIKFGTDVTYSVSRYDIDRNEAVKLYSFEKIYVPKNLDIRSFAAWTNSGLNPADDSLLIAEHIKPPVIPPYSRFFALDFLDGKTRPVTHADIKKFYSAGSFSPDGTRVALADINGAIEILGPEKAVFSPGMKASGLYPAWNPKGSQIFIGGFVIDSDGNRSEELVPQGANSIGWWSPDGKKIAVISREELSVIEGFTPRFIQPDRPLDETFSRKVLAIRESLLELLREGLLSPKEYADRYERLIREQRKDR